MIAVVAVLLDGDRRMALNKTQLSKVANLNSIAGGSGSRQLWNYVTTDALSAVAVAGYFNDARGYLREGDEVLVIASDGFGVLAFATVPATGNITVSRQATSGGGKVASGVHTTVTASDAIVTGLATVAVVVATLADDPAAGLQFVTATVGNQAGAPAAGSITIKGWKSTATADTAQVAATTFGKKVNWIAFGA